MKINAAGLVEIIDIEPGVFFTHDGRYFLKNQSGKSVELVSGEIYSFGSGLAMTFSAKIQDAQTEFRYLKMGETFYHDGDLGIRTRDFESISVGVRNAVGLNGGVWNIPLDDTVIRVDAEVNYEG